MRTSVRVLPLLLLLSTIVSAAPAGPVDLAALVGGADVIVVGRVASLLDMGPAAGDLRMFRGAIDVDAVIKGPQIGVVRFTSAQRAALAATPAAECDIFFLKGGPVEFHFVSTDYAAVPGLCGVEPGEADDLLQKVTIVIGAAAKSRSLPREVRQRAISVLAGASPDAAVASLRRVLLDPDREIQVTAAAALLALGDTSPLPLVEGALVRPDSELAVDPLAPMLGDAVARIDDPRAIPSLVRLAKAPNARVRQAAAQALGHTRSPLAIGPLTDALDDAALDVRYAAVLAFAEVAGAPEWTVTLEAFRADPDRYVGHWRDWAAARAR